MKLEKQVCSLDLAKRLKELGVKQESLWYYNPDGLLWSIEDKRSKRQMFSAFTVAELENELLKQGISYIVTPDGIETIDRNSEFKDENKANARAAMLVYLKEKKLI